MTETPGIDTIQGLIGTPPKVIEISRNSIRVADSVRQIWNTKYLAFLPYCYNCKEPLVWHMPPRKDSVLFHCPKCKREWVKDEEWVEKEKSNG